MKKIVIFNSPNTRVAGTVETVISSKLSRGTTIKTGEVLSIKSHDPGEDDIEISAEVMKVTRTYAMVRINAAYLV